ncbi:MAG: HEAT repeat domain-containing protein [Gemmataceae bacterium]
MTKSLPIPAPPADTIADLVRQLRHRLSTTRVAAVKALGKLGWLSGDTINPLYQSLSDESDDVREAAAQVIGQLGPNAIPFMIRMLGNKDKYVRRHAVWALGKLGPKAVPAIGALCQSLKDADPRTATGAAQAIGEMGVDGTPAVSELADAMRGTNVVLCRLAAKSLSQIGLPALPTLLTHLGHHDPFVKNEAAVAIGWIGPKALEAIPKLVELLNMISPLAGLPPASPEDTPSPIDTARAAAATALGRIGPAAESSLPVLQKYIKDPCPAVNQAVAMAIRLISTNRR